LRLKEDPLVLIKQKEMEMRAEVMNNPMTLKKIQKEIQMLKDAKSHKHKHRKEKKDKRDKKHKKNKHRRSRSRSNSESSDSHNRRRSPEKNVSKHNSEYEKCRE
jgi:hypothetical protein